MQVAMVPGVAPGYAALGPGHPKTGRVLRRASRIASLVGRGVDHLGHGACAQRTKRHATDGGLDGLDSSVEEEEIDDSTVLAAESEAVPPGCARIVSGPRTAR